MILTIPVLYSCDGCGLAKVQVDVMTRAHDQDVADWMRQVQVALSRDHARRSPDCDSREMRDVMIPLTGRNLVGGPTVQ